MKKKTLFWILLFAALALAGGGFYALGGGGGVTASVYVDGELYGTYDLTAAVIPYEVTIRTEDGFNTLRIGRGSVRVIEADCPGRDCVRQGAIHDSLLPIVCLPHRMVIEIDE